MSGVVTAVPGGRRILCDPARTPGLGAGHFDPAWWIARDAVIAEARGRGAVLIVRHEGAQWVLRHFRRGGWAHRLSEDRYVWTGLERTRPWREWRILERMHADGLPVPAPVAASVVRRGPFYTGDLLSGRIPATGTLAAALVEGPLPREEWRALGRLIARFQERGVRHDDINISNVLRSAPGVFHLIDFDKAAIVAPGRWRDRNLARFRRSLDKLRTRKPETHFSDREWSWLLAGHAGGASAGG